MAPASTSRERGFEVSDASVRGVLFAALLVVSGTALVLGGVRLMMLGPDNSPAAFGNTTRRGSFTFGPDEETSVQQSWDALNQELATTMNGYGWVDRQQGIVRIPIERAMELVAAESQVRPGSGGTP